MKQRCQETEQCVAFNSNGEFKSRLKSQKEWVLTSESEGLYVAGECYISLKGPGGGEGGVQS